MGVHGRFLHAIVAAALVGRLAAIARAEIDLEVASHYLRLADHLAERDGGAFGRHDLRGPLMLVDAATREAAANLPDDQGRLKRVGDDLYMGVLPDDVAVGNTAIEWGGRRWAVVLWPLPRDVHQAGSLLMHETFHRIQLDLGFTLDMVDCGHLDEADGRTLLRLEWRALEEALRADDDAMDGPLADALLFRAVRHARHRGSAERERILENNEGLAEYTGLRLGGHDADEQRVLAIDGLAHRATLPSLTRLFAYGAGPAYGLLLDRADPEWRRRLTPSLDGATLLARTRRIRIAKRDHADAEARAARYGLDEIRREEEIRAAERTLRRDALKARLVDGPVLAVPGTPGMRFTFDIATIESVAGHGIVHKHLEGDGGWGSLRVANGVLLETDDRGRPQRMMLPAPEDPTARPLAGDGWTLDLAAGWTVVKGARDGDWEVVRVGDRRARGPRVRGR